MATLCRKCGQPLDPDEQAFGSPETEWEHPFSCPDERTNDNPADPPESAD